MATRERKERRPAFSYDRTETLELRALGLKLRWEHIANPSVDDPAASGYQLAFGAREPSPFWAGDGSPEADGYRTYTIGLPDSGTKGVRAIAALFTELADLLDERRSRS